MSISTGRLASTFAKREASGELGTAVALASADYFESTAAIIEGEAFALVPSPEKTPGQDLWESFSRRPTTSARVSALIRGAKTGITKPALDPLLAEAMGSEALIVDAAGDATDSSNVGKIICIAGMTDGMFRPAKIPATGAAAPMIALEGSAIYKSVNYNLGDELLGLTLRYQPLDKLSSPKNGTGPGTKGAPPQLASGWVIDSTTFTLDGTAEASVEFNGPAVRVVEGAGAGDDVDEPTAGSTQNPPNGLACKMWYQDRSAETPAWAPITHPFRTLTIRQTTPRRLRNDEAGNTYALGAYIAGQRETTLEWSTYAEEGNPIWEAIRQGKAAGGQVPYFRIFVALGNTEGARAGFYLPKVAFNLPQGDDGQEMVAWSFSGRAHSDTFGEGNSSLAVSVG